MSENVATELSNNSRKDDEKGKRWWKRNTKKYVTKNDATTDVKQRGSVWTDGGGAVRGIDVETVSPTVNRHRSDPPRSTLPYGKSRSRRRAANECETIGRSTAAAAICSCPLEAFDDDDDRNRGKKDTTAYYFVFLYTKPPCRSNTGFPAVWKWRPNGTDFV